MKIHLPLWLSKTLSTSIYSVVGGLLSELQTRDTLQSFSVTRSSIQSHAQQHYIRFCCKILQLILHALVYSWSKKKEKKTPSPSFSLTGLKCKVVKDVNPCVFVLELKLEKKKRGVGLISRRPGYFNCPFLVKWPGSPWWGAGWCRESACEPFSSARTLSPGCWARLHCSQSEFSGHTQTYRRSACPALCWSCLRHSNTCKRAGEWDGYTDGTCC